MKIHKLTKKEAQRISNIFNLGKVKSITVFSGGLINSNYKLKTDKGKFVVRIIGSTMDEWKRKRLALERKTLLFLDNKKFPYEIPVPLKNMKGKYLSRINGKTYWIYKMLHGKSRKRLNESQFKEMAKGMATYHKFIKGMKFHRSKRDFKLTWFLEKYKEMREKFKRMTNGNKLDILMKDNFELLHRLVKRLSKMDFITNVLVVHGDVYGDNILFKEDKLKGFLDFDNLKIAPRAEDVAYALRLGVVSSKYGLNKRKMNSFLKEYEKINKLSKKEKEMLVPLMIRGNVIVLWWMYNEMKKEIGKKHHMIKWTLEINKHLVKEWEKQLGEKL